MTEHFFQAYLQGYQPFKPYWNYEDGCVLLGCIRMFRATGDRRYADFVMDYLSQRIAADGSITTYPAEQQALDSFHCSKSLFFAADRSGDPRYEKAIRWQAAQILTHPRTGSGMLWHKKIYPHQIWLDGIYMAAPFCAAYAKHTGNSGILREIGHWFAFLHEHLCDCATGLYYHALDESKSQPWAEPETGRSASFWLRGEGWFLMALADTLALLPPQETEIRRQLSALLHNASVSLLHFRTAEGLFCQVIDKPELPGNYTETSGSLMAAYAFMRGAALDVLPAAMLETGADILQTIKKDKLRKTPDGIRLTDICGAAGLGGTECRDGSPAYYLSEPRNDNDPKGVGTLMSAEALLRLSRLMSGQRTEPADAGTGA